MNPDGIGPAPHPARPARYHAAGPAPTRAARLAERHADIVDAVRRARRLLHRQAALGSLASAVPLPGLDALVDAALLSRLIPRINAEFGLSPAQIEALDPARRVRTQQALALVGSALVGRLVTRQLVLRSARALGWRPSPSALARAVPWAAGAASAALGYATVRYLGEQHIRDCVRVALLASEAQSAATAPRFGRPEWPPAPGDDTAGNPPPPAAAGNTPSA